MKRQCGKCQLCCKLLPMADKKRIDLKETKALMVEAGEARRSDFLDMEPDFFKPAGERCKHQRSHKGCYVYERRPFGCRYWTCQWLTGHFGADDRPPHHAHYVIDSVLDVITIHPDNGEKIDMGVLVVWCDPDHPEAFRDPALLSFIEEHGKKGYACLVRFNETDAITLFPPSMTGAGWHEVRGGRLRDETTAEQRWAAAGPDTFAATQWGSR